MRRSLATFLLLSLLCCFAWTDAGAETKKTPKPKKDQPKAPKYDGPEYGMDFIKADFVPTCQWRDVLTKVTGPDILFCKQSVPCEVNGDTITLTIGENKVPVKAGDKHEVVEIPAGDKVLFLGLVYAKGAWHYYNAKLARAVSLPDKFMLYGFDVDNDGEYFAPKRDGIVWPGQKAVVPWRGGKFWFDNKMAQLTHEGEFEILLDPIQGPKEELDALKLINEFRVGAGLHPLVYNAELSDKCRKHSAYIAANGGPEIDTPYQENPGATGATPEGAAVAGSSFYYFSAVAADAIQAHLSHIFYRPLYIRGTVDGMGIGFSGGVFTFNSGDPVEQPQEYRYPIMTPAPGQTIQYLNYGVSGITYIGHDPRPGESGCAFPILLTCDWGEKMELTDAKLFEVRKGKELALQVVLSAPNKPSVPNYFPDNRGVVEIGRASCRERV